MKFTLLVSLGLALVLAASSRDTGLDGLCYVNGVDKFLPLSECLRWVRDNGHRMLWEDSEEQALVDVGNHVEEIYLMAEEEMLPEEWRV